MAASSFACQCLEKKQMVQTSLRSLQVNKKHITVIDSLIIISLFAVVQGLSASSHRKASSKWGDFQYASRCRCLKQQETNASAFPCFTKPFLSTSLSILFLRQTYLYVYVIRILQALCTVALTSHVKVLMKNKKTKYRLQ